MTETAPPRQLPVRLPPYPDELLSSWISRHAAFYAVPPLVMLQHCLPEASSLRAVDLHLSGDQEVRLASIFAAKPAVLRRMTFINVPKSSHRLIAARPARTCARCSPGSAEPAPILRNQLLGWRITCVHCGTLLRGFGKGELRSPFRQNHRAALRGEKLLDDEAERGHAQRDRRLAEGDGAEAAGRASGRLGVDLRDLPEDDRQRDAGRLREHRADYDVQVARRNLGRGLSRSRPFFALRARQSGSIAASTSSSRPVARAASIWDAGRPAPIASSTRR